SARLAEVARRDRTGRMRAQDRAEIVPDEASGREIRDASRPDASGRKRVRDRAEVQAAETAKNSHRPEAFATAPAGRARHGAGRECAVDGAGVDTSEAAAGADGADADRAAGAGEAGPAELDGQRQRWARDESIVPPDEAARSVKGDHA